MLLRCAAMLGIVALSAAGAEAATYMLRGSGVCISGGVSRDCNAETTFALDPALYGQIGVPLIGPYPVHVFYTDGQEATGGSIHFEDSISANSGVPGSCTDICANISTDVDGALLDLISSCYNCNLFTFFTSNWWSIETPDIQAYGPWSLISAPVPASLPLMLGALGGLGLLVPRRKRRSSTAE